MYLSISEDDTHIYKFEVRKKSKSKLKYFITRRRNY